MKNNIIKNKCDKLVNLVTKMYETAIVLRVGYLVLNQMRFELLLSQGKKPKAFLDFPIKYIVYRVKRWVGVTDGD